MAVDVVTTSEQLAVDALAQLAAAEREMANWRAHLSAVATGSSSGAGLAARRCACIVGNLVGEARALTVAADPSRTAVARPAPAVA